jgi:hypothetical protein
MKRYKPIFAGVVIVIVVFGLIFYIQGPRLQARSMLIDLVGEDYFNSFMEFKGVHYNLLEPAEWLTSYQLPVACVKYDYHIQVGNYSTNYEVIFIFDLIRRLVFSTGVPPSDNLMPFNVTQEEAIKIAMEQAFGFPPDYYLWIPKEDPYAKPGRYLEPEAKIEFVEHSVNNLPFNRYVWFVNVYLTEKSAISGTVIVVLIDLHSSEVIDVAELRWSTDTD